MKPATLRRPASSGFTLIETLVVMTISIGLVVLMAMLFRSVGLAAIVLKGDDREWIVQTLLREQLSRGFNLPNKTWIEGSAHQLTFLTWKSRITGLEGKPVIAQYRFEPGARALNYREAVLPAWWGDRPWPALNQLAADLEAAPPVKLLGTVDALSFNFIAADASDLEEVRWQAFWQQSNLPPKLIVLRINGVRESMLWLDVRAIDVL